MLNSNSNRLQNDARSVLGCVLYGKTIGILDNVVNRRSRRLIERLKSLWLTSAIKNSSFTLALGILIPIEGFGEL